MNLDKICRFCLEEVKPLINVHESDIGIPAKIEALSSVIEIKEGDGLPDQVCQFCVDQLETCYRFIQKCEDSDYALKQYLQKDEQETGKVPLEVEANIEEEDLHLSDVVQTEFTASDAHLQMIDNSGEYIDAVEQKREDTSTNENDYGILRTLLAAKSGTELEHGLPQDNQGEVLHRLLATAASNGVEIKAVKSTPINKVTSTPDSDADDVKSWKLFGPDSVNLGTFYTSTGKMKFSLPSSSNQEMIDLAMLPFTRYSSLLEEHCKNLQTTFHEQRLRRPSAHQKPHSNRAVIVDCYNCALRCHEKLGAPERAKIHKEFHELEDYAAQRSYINSRVERFEPRRRKTNKPSRRKISQIFTLEHGGVVHRVCKKFFLSTLDISDKKARIFLKRKTVQKTASSLLLKRGMSPIDASYFMWHNADTCV